MKAYQILPRILRLSLCVMVCIFIVASLSGEARARTAAHVLVLHSYHYGYTWTDSLTEGIYSTFADKAPLDNIVVEYMNTKRHPTELIFPHLRVLYADIYRNTHFDLIITTDDNALEFILRYRDELFPKTPVVFCGINNLDNARLRKSKNITGVAEKIEIESTLNLIKQLQPDVTTVAVIAGMSESGRINLKLFREAIQHVDELSALDLSELPVDEIQAQLNKLDSTSVVLNLGLSRSTDGHIFTVDQGINLITQATNRPIYTAWDFAMKPGVVGGNLVSGKHQGAAAANLAIMILNGESADHIPFQESPNANIFDYIELQRYNIPLNRLPSSYILLNAPTPFFTIDRSTGIILIIVSLCIIAVSLLLHYNIKTRRIAAQAMSSTEERFKQLADAAWEAIIIQDEGIIHQVNNQFYPMFGYSLAESKKIDSVEMLIAPESRREFRRHLREDDTTPFDVLAMRKEGSTFPVEMRIKQMDFHGIKAGVLVVRDITERKLIEVKLAEINKTLENLVFERTKTLDQKASELEIANRKLLELDELKSSFMSTVSHDIRTPLTSIIGFTKLISKEFKSSFVGLVEEDSRLAKKRDRIITNLAIIEEEGERLKRLINDFLDLTRIESGSAEWHDQKIDIARLIQQATAVVSGLMPKGAAARIHMEIHEDLPVLHADPDRIMQVLTNLLGNAAKFTPPDKSIIIDVSTHNNAVEIRVTDEGPGIPAKDLVNIFDKFYQVGRGETTPETPKGTGLGLAICKQIIEHYKGHIHAESVLGKGSTFTFSLPV